MSMTEKEITAEILRYLSDYSYRYAIMIDGEWGCGKTYYVKKKLIPAILDHQSGAEKPIKPKYLSLYGCKSVSEAQENIVYTLASEYRKEKLPSIIAKANKGSENLMLSSWRIAKAIRDTCAPSVNIYDIAGKWLNLSSYVFIIDDLERCSCPLNDLFGFINSLVEHEGVKVILVANEKEIRTTSAQEEKELKYLVALNSDIQFPEQKDILGRRIRDDKLNVEELERRASYLFPTAKADNVFTKIREKLIGVTLSYRPNLTNAFSDIINNSSFCNEQKELLLSRIYSFQSRMNSLEHNNLRTFQFFLSKLSFILFHLENSNLMREYHDELIRFIVDDCFASSVDFKGNRKSPSDHFEKISYELEMDSRLKSVKEYVECGKLSVKLLESELADFVRKNVLNLIPSDDPYKILRNEYYLHPQKWCEKQLEELTENLRKGSYPLVSYFDIIKTMLMLENVGFEKRYLDDVKAIMIENISKTEHPQRIDGHLFIYNDTPEVKNRFNSILEELNAAVAQKSSDDTTHELSAILDEENWAVLLQEFIDHSHPESSRDAALLYKAGYDRWVSLIENASPKSLHTFRECLQTLYPNNVHRPYGVKDLDTIEQIAEWINPDSFSDIIVKATLQWLKHDLEEICEMYRD